MNKLPLVMDTFDGEYALGSIGIATNGLSDCYFDKVRIEPIDVLDAGNETSNALYIPPRCSRYKESFMAAMDYTWRTHDPLWDAIDDPSNWKFVNDFEGKNAIYQSTNMHTNG